MVKILHSVDIAQVIFHMQLQTFKLMAWNMLKNNLLCVDVLKKKKEKKVRTEQQLNLQISWNSGNIYETLGISLSLDTDLNWCLTPSTNVDIDVCGCLSLHKSYEYKVKHP